MRFYKCIGVYMRTTVLITVSRIVRTRRICVCAVYQLTGKIVSAADTIKKAVIKMKAKVRRKMLKTIKADWVNLCIYGLEPFWVSLKAVSNFAK